MPLPAKSHTDRYALLDCNNFFVSCERVFNPKLRNKPVAVLSNNDGCIIARSEEVKKLGIPMCAVVFEWREVIDRNNVILCSGNFSLYEDLSNRVFQSLREFCEQLEIYSIDEAFLRLPWRGNDRLLQDCRNIKEKIYQWTGIPVSIGIGVTKTQAKLANKIAKKYLWKNSVNLLDNIVDCQDLNKLDLTDVWGIGYRFERKLKVLNINSIKDFLLTDRSLIKQEFGVLLEKTWLELHGIRCFPIDTNRTAKKEILCSRTFKQMHSEYSRLEQAIAKYTDTACANLRKQSSLAGSISVFLTTGSKHSVYERSSKTHTQILDIPTDNTPILTKQALTGLKKIYQPGVKYKRAGVYLTNFYQKSEIQKNIFASYDLEKSRLDRVLMGTFDNINKTWGKGTVKFASQGVNAPEIQEQLLKSPRYTTSWLELPKIGSRFAA